MHINKTLIASGGSPETKKNSEDDKDFDTKSGDTMLLSNGLATITPSIYLGSSKKYIAFILREYGMPESGIDGAVKEIEECYAREQRSQEHDNIPAETAPKPMPPEKAPELYRDGERDPHTDRRLEFVPAFIERVYAKWIVDGELTFGREGLKRLDPECETAVAQWLGNRPTGSLFGMTTRSKITPPTLEQVREARRVVKWAERNKPKFEQEPPER